MISQTFQIEPKEHPAKYTDSLLPIFEIELDGYERVLDPFAGTGKLRIVRPDAELLEIEPEWAIIRNATVGDALDIPWPEHYFDAICTSPCYGNRMSDHHNAKDGSKRYTYRHLLERELHPNNAGKLQWGKQYRAFHYKAWQEVYRVLKPNGKFILNISDHIRKGKIMPVSKFHRLLLLFMGFEHLTTYKINTPRQRHGQNHEKRVNCEYVFIFKKGNNI